MSATDAAKAFLIFTGSGPILMLCTYPSVTDQRLIEKLHFKGIDRFLAYEVDMSAVRERYPLTFEGVSADLEGVEDIRVLDFNGHQIMANFSLDELGEPVKYGG